MPPIYIGSSPISALRVGALIVSAVYVGSVQAYSANTDPIAPTNITLSASSVSESASVGTVVGLLGSNGYPSATYSKILDAGSKFSIVGNELRIAAALDYETATSHSVTIRATNASGSYDKIFAISVTNTTELPVNTVAPSISGAPTQGGTLTGTDGTWTSAAGAISYVRAWLRDGIAISGATGSTYVLDAADVGAMIGYRVTATNSDGSTQTTSGTVGPVVTSVVSFDPLSLYASSEKGVVLDLTDMTRLYQDSARTSPVTAIGQFIGAASDATTSGYHAVQATAGAQPIYRGWPKTTGAELLSNGRFDAGDTVWTEGSGWTITGTRAAKTAGSASSLSQPITLAAGKVYLVHYCLTRTAGTVLARLTGGSAVAGLARSVGGSSIEMLIATSGDTTFEFYADAAFVGEVYSASVKEVTAWLNPGAEFDGLNDRLRTAAITMSSSKTATLIIAGRGDEPSNNRFLAQFGSSPASVPSFTLESATQPRSQLVDATVGATIATPAAESISYGDSVVTVEIDTNAAVGADQARVRTRGIYPTLTTTGTAIAAGAALPNGVLTIGSPFNNNSWLNGSISRALLINRKLTTAELKNAEKWARGNRLIAAVLGDSTITTVNVSTPMPNAYAVSLMTGCLICGSADVSRAGDRIADQKLEWNNIADKSALEVVMIQLGLNDVKGRIGNAGVSTSTVIADLQDLVNTVNADKPAGCKVYISQINPCKGWLDVATDPAAAWAGWQAYNDAIAGLGATPITGVDGRITSHIAQLNDGAGYLKSIYNYNVDDVHESGEARYIIAQAWRAKLESDGLI